MAEAGPNGYMGRFLRVDLTRGTVKSENLPDTTILRRYLGGEALSAWYVMRELPLSVRALDRDAMIAMFTGPLTGTGFTPGGAKICAAFLSPMTGNSLGYSNTAGYWGVELRQAGYDGIILTGAAAGPVYLFITDTEVVLRDASRVWGKGTRESEELLRVEVGLPDARVATIGPAGENRIKAGMVVNDFGHNLAHGVGAIFGSKNLKAIVIRGTRRPPVCDRGKLIAAGDRWRAVVTKRTPAMKRTVGYGGSWGAVNKLNWRSSVIEPEDTRGFETNRVTLRPCFQCNVLAPWVVEVGEGPHKGDLLQFNGGTEVLDAFYNLGIKGNDVLYLWHKINDVGIECAHFSCAAGIAFEAWEKGLLTREQTGGLELKWGDVQVVERLLEMTARREGWLGELIAQGPKELADAIGGDAPNWAVHVKGGVPAMHDWRPLIGDMLRELVASGTMKPQGGGLASPPPDLTYRENWGPLDPRKPDGWAHAHFVTERYRHFMGLIGGCWHAQNPDKPDGLKSIVDSLAAATGWDFTMDESLEAGHRAILLRSLFDAQRGWKAEDDWINVGPRFLEPVPDGKYKGFTIAPFLPGLIQEYYRLSGRDPASGRPSLATLKRLGMDEFARHSHEEAAAHGV
jgi:aldehyde:ferredoxin oxidoreductase